MREDAGNGRLSRRRTPPPNAMQGHMLLPGGVTVGRPGVPQGEYVNGGAVYVANLHLVNATHRAIR